MLAILLAVVLCGWMTTSCCLQVAQFSGELRMMLGGPAGIRGSAQPGSEASQGTRLDTRLGLDTGSETDDRC